MGTFVKIKDVERTSIWLKETNITHATWIFCLVWSLLLIAAIILVVIVMPRIPVSSESAWSVVLYIMLLLIFMMLQLMFSVGCITIPAYELYILDVSGDIIIEKVSPEKDRVAICNATRELEQKARQWSKKKRDLEQIACKCK